MAHSVIVPFVVAALLLRRRTQLSAIHPRPSFLGIIPLALGVFGYGIALWGGGLFLAVLSGVASALGVILLTLGAQIFRMAMPSLSLCVFAFPRLNLVYDPLTNPLQQLSATIATHALALFGVDATHSAALISVGGSPVVLTEACSGVRFLLPLLFVAAVIAEICKPRWTAAAALLASTIPLTLAVNALRIAVLAYIVGAKHTRLFDLAHTWLSYPLYLLALLLLLSFAKRTGQHSMMRMAS
jgi:exosortase